MPFGLVGSKNREVPMANERVEQAMRVRNLTRHYGRVRHAQPATDHGEPTDQIKVHSVESLGGGRGQTTMQILVPLTVAVIGVGAFCYLQFFAE